MKRLIIFIVFLFGCFCTSVFGQRKISLTDAMQLLHDNSISLKQGELREQIAKNTVEIAKGGIYPNLFFNTNNQHTMGMVFDQISGKLITGNQWSNYATGNLGTSVILYQGGQKQSGIKIEQLKLELAALDNKRLMRELELQLLAIFIQVLVNHDLWEAGKSQLKFSEQQLQQEKTLMDIGKRTLIDYSQAKAKYANDKLNVVTAKNAFDLSLMKLKQLLEMDLSEELEVLAPKELLVNSVLPIYHLSSDPYLKVLDKQIEIGEAQVKLSRSSYFPTITLNGSYGTNYSSQRQNSLTGNTIPFWNQFNQNRTLSGSLSLSIPIFDGLKTKFTIRNAKLNQQSLRYEKEKIKRERLQIISQGEMEYQAAIEERSAILATYEANKINYEGISERYKVGKSSSIDLYKAMTEFNISEFRLITSSYAVFYKREFLMMINN